MIVTVLIALAGGCASALDVRLDRLGRADLVAAALSRAAAADGDRARLGPACRQPSPLPPPRLRWAPSSAFPTASVTSSAWRCRPGGLAISRLLGRPVASSRQWRGTAPRSRMVSGRPHPGLDRGLRVADDLLRAVVARHRCCGNPRRIEAGSAADPGGARHRGRREGAGCAGDDHAGLRRPRHRRHAHDQSLARRKDHRDVRPVAPAMAGPEDRGAAESCACRALRCRRLYARRRPACHRSHRSSPRR